MSRTTGAEPKSAARSTHVVPAFPNSGSGSPLGSSRIMTAPVTPRLSPATRIDPSSPSGHRRHACHRVRHGVS
jgi:hypothetical protein